MNDLQNSAQVIYSYRSYLVRFWQSHEEGRWRASAQSVQTGETTLFGDVASLLDFLQARVQDKPEGDGTASIAMRPDSA